MLAQWRTIVAELPELVRLALVVGFLGILALYALGLTSLVVAAYAPAGRGEHHASVSSGHADVAPVIIIGAEPTAVPTARPRVTATPVATPRRR